MKKKGVLLFALLSVMSLVSCGGGEATISSSEEVIESIFPSAGIKEFFSAKENMPEFKANTYYEEKNLSEDNKCYVVYAEKSETSSISYFESSLPLLDFEINHNEESNYYVAESDFSSYKLVYYETVLEEKDYFLVQYYFDQKDYVNVSKEFAFFPGKIIKNILGSNYEIPRYISLSYTLTVLYDAETGISLCSLSSNASSNASSSVYKETLINNGYEVDSTNLAINEEKDYLIAFYEENNIFSVDIMLYSDYSTFPEVNDNFLPVEDIAAYLGLSEYIPAYIAEEYNYVEQVIDNTKYVIISSPLSSTACDEAYEEILISKGYVIEECVDNDGIYYVAYNTSSGYQIVYYETETEFVLEISKYEEDEEESNPDYDEDFVEVTTFPHDIICEFFATDSLLVEFDADYYYYARFIDTDNYDYIYLYAEISSSACNSAYKNSLENNGYEVIEDEDEYGVYYYAYNDNTGYEIIFFEDPEYDTFDLNIYYYGTTSGEGGNTGDDSDNNESLANPIVLDGTHYDNKGYVEKTYTVSSYSFSSDRVMLSTNTSYAGAMQFSSQEKGSGTIYNNDPINGMKKIEIDLNYSSEYNMVVYVSNSATGEFVKASMTNSGDIYSYNVSGYTYFKVVNESARACYINTITIS